MISEPISGIIDLNAREIKADQKLTLGILQSSGRLNQEVIDELSTYLVDEVLILGSEVQERFRQIKSDKAHFSPLIEAAGEGWILLMRAEEFLAREDYSRLAHLLHHPLLPCYEFMIANARHKGFGIRLFHQKAGIDFDGREPVLSSESNLRYKPFRCNITLQSKGDVSAEHYNRKAFSLRVTEVRALQNPTDARILADLGIEYLECGRWQAALEPLSRSLQLRPGQPQVCNALGYALMELRRYPEAEATWEALLSQMPEFHLAYTNLGVCALRQDDLQSAVNYFNKGLSLQPDDPQLHHNLGICMKRAQSFPHAVQHFRAALRFNPKYEAPKIELALLLSQVGETKEAEALLMELRRPSLPIVEFALAALFAAQGKTEEALCHWSELKTNHEVLAEKLLTQSPPLKELVSCTTPS